MIEYIQVEKSFYEKLMNTYSRLEKIAEWENIEYPTTDDVCLYTGVSIHKINKDMAKADCPLRIYQKGGKGRNNQNRFIKKSVEIYKKDFLRK